MVRKNLGNLFNYDEDTLIGMTIHGGQKFGQCPLFIVLLMRIASIYIYRFYFIFFFFFAVIYFAPTNKKVGMKDLHTKLMIVYSGRSIQAIN